MMSGLNNTNKMFHSIKVSIFIVAGAMLASCSNFVSYKSTDPTPIVTDLHYKTLIGTGWLGNKVEPGGVIKTTTSKQSNAGSYEIDVVDAGLFLEGQLISVIAENKEYYSYVIAKINGSHIIVERPIESSISVGSPIYNFYLNDAHPNEFGYRAIADDFFRQLKFGKRLAYPASRSITWVTSGKASATQLKSKAYTNPGGLEDGDESIKVVAETAGDGVITTPVALPEGDHLTSVLINPGETGNKKANTVNVSIVLDNNGVEEKITDQDLALVGRVGVVNLQYNLSQDGTVRVRVLSKNSQQSTFLVGSVTHFKIVEEVEKSILNKGKHVMLGDSWFSSPYIMDRLKEHLPEADFVNKGIGGNRANQLILRFGSDVIKQKPDFVWIMVGTNDYYDPNTTQPLFEKYIEELKILTQTIGAQLIIFTPSVGDITYNNPPIGEQLSHSRHFVQRTQYFNLVEDRPEN